MKKIDINKSTILGTKENDTVDLKLGITGYFSHYSNFETYVEGELEGFTYSEFMTTEEDPDGDYGNQWYDYFIPEDEVVFIKEEEPKKKQYRPFKNFEEFANYVGLRDSDKVQFIGFRSKSGDIYDLAYNGYKKDRFGNICIHLGSLTFTLQELFKSYEYELNSFECVPFGIECEEVEAE